MPKFDWGAFLGAFSKTGIDTFKDVRGQEITRSHYKAQEQLGQAELERRQRELEIKERANAHEQGANAPSAEPSWQPGGGIGGGVVAGQLGIPSPGGGPYSSGEESFVSQGSMAGLPPPTPPEPTGPVPTQGTRSLEEARRAARSAIDPMEQSRLYGAVARLEKQQEDEVNGTLGDFADRLKVFRDTEAGSRVTQDGYEKALAQYAQLDAQRQAAVASGDTQTSTRLGAQQERLNVLLAQYKKAIDMTPATLQALRVDLARHRRSLLNYGVNEELVDEYVGAYKRGGDIGYLGRQILRQGSGRRVKPSAPRGTVGGATRPAR